MTCGTWTGTWSCLRVTKKVAKVLLQYVDKLRMVQRGSVRNSDHAPRKRRISGEKGNQESRTCPSIG